MPFAPQFDPSALRLYAITEDGAALFRGVKQRIRLWLEAGVRTIQLREKKLSAAEIVPFGKFLRAITAEYGALFIVNDDPVLAQLLEADGCHLGWDDMKPAEARKILGPEKIIGLSTHSREQVLAAAGIEADYIGVGPIFPSPTKQAVREPLGPELAGWAAGAVEMPVVAIGGISIGNAARVASAGCPNVAVISALNKTQRPGEVVRAFLDILQANTPASLG
ncbi:thiamine phosphate synthase [Candidatus Sumerlaeota bacterium]|nr:thiamine phosphate synthase [Candidatus Sumerlaeota bacterium]